MNLAFLSCMRKDKFFANNELDLIIVTISPSRQMAAWGIYNKITALQIISDYSG